MDFFERQDKARRKTKLLVFYFALAVICIVAAVYLASLIVFTGVVSQSSLPRSDAALAVWNPKVFALALLGTLIVVGGGTAYRLASLATGGRSVAESLGGRLVRPDTTDLDERKLLNVVEEMALASGVPVPQVYVLDDEAGINAFAAGHAPGDAVIGVTRGCMKLLTRDELQGVIGHEYSHILNGDMRLNMRLIGLVFGIMCLAIIGRLLLRTRGRKNPLPALGLALIIIGWVGVFFGRLIQAAVSRQREFLADASSVQFTRNPAGLSGALRKIGGLTQGSCLRCERASEASHMFFGNALRSSFLGAFSTHPPLDKRIRAIDPAWDGRFSQTAAPAPAEKGQPTAGRPPGEHGAAGTARMGGPFMIGAATVGSSSVRPESVLPNIGQPTPLHLRYAVELRNSFPDSVRSAADEPSGAMALVFVLLLSKDPALRQRQLMQIKQQLGGTVNEKIVALAPEVEQIATRARLPLADLTLPALRRLTPDEYTAFVSALDWLVASDQQIDLFEYVLQRLVRRHLEPHFAPVRPPVVQYYTIRPLLPDCAVLLSALAHVGTAEADRALKAFTAGTPYLRSNIQPAFRSCESCGLGDVEQALDRLAQAAPLIKRNVVEACIRVVGADGVIQEAEAELLRGVADTLDCPIPPFID